jgi:hypothetical protein
VPYDGFHGRIGRYYVKASEYPISLIATLTPAKEFSMRASFTVLIVAATIGTGGCRQTVAPNSPSSVAAATSAATPDSVTTQAGKPSGAATTALLVCDSAANAQVDFRLVDDLFTGTPLSGTVHLECGPDSLSGSRRDTVKVTTFAQAGWAFVDVFAVQAGAFIGGCPGGTAVPGSAECPGGGSKKSPVPGATLTFK